MSENEKVETTEEIDGPEVVPHTQREEDVEAPGSCIGNSGNTN